MRLSPADLKRRYEILRPEEHYFTRSSMHFFGDTMSNYSTSTFRAHGEWWIALNRKRPVKHGLQSTTYFRHVDMSHSSTHPDEQSLPLRGHPEIIQHLLQSPDDAETPDLLSFCTVFSQRFHSEFVHTTNLAYYKHNLHDMVSAFLSGMPLNIVYSNSDIVDLHEKLFGLQLTESGCHLVVENWFDFVAGIIIHSCAAVMHPLHLPDLSRAKA